MGAAMEIEPRTSMERHLMDRDREGQLYLEARRQQAVQDLLLANNDDNNRTSFLSTITPPSTNPSSAASSLFHEPLSSSSGLEEQDQHPSISMHRQQHQQSYYSSTGTSLLATPPTSPLSPFPSSSLSTSPTTTTTAAGKAHTPVFSTATSTFLSLASPTSLIASKISGSNKKKTFSAVTTRQRSASASASAPASGQTTMTTMKGSGFDRPVVAISPSSLEYQLTASLLKYHHPVVSPSSSTTTTTATVLPTSSSSQPAKGSNRSRSKSRPRKPRRGTVGGGYDARMDISLSRSTGHHHHEAPAAGIEKQVCEGRAKSVQQHTVATIKTSEPRPLLGSLPSSSTAVTAVEDASNSQPILLSKVPPSPPLPPLPPKSPRSLIATYFPGSLPPPPSRDRHVVRHMGPMMAPTPFKTPTFGPALILSATTTAGDIVPPLPSPSASFHYIPSTNLSRSSSTAAGPTRTDLPRQIQEESDLLPPSSRPSPSTSALGVSTDNNVRDCGSRKNSRSKKNVQLPASSFSRLPSDLDLFMGNNSNANSGVAGSAALPAVQARRGEIRGGRFPNQYLNINQRSLQQQQQQQQQQQSINKFSVLHNANASASPVATATAIEVSANHDCYPPSHATSITLFPSYPYPYPSFSETRHGSNATTATTTGWTTANASTAALMMTIPATAAMATAPVYPRGLMPSSSSPLSEAHLPVIIRVQQKAMPYMRELVPGKEDRLHPDAGTQGGTSSTHTSRDLEIVLEEISGRIRTNRTSIDPWPLYYDPRRSSYFYQGMLASPWSQKPLPPVRRERGSRYWVFRDEDGKLVIGPILFLLGHVCPILWWIGTVFPRTEHPDDLLASERGEAGHHQQQQQEEQHDSDLREHPIIQWLQRQLRTVGATIASIKTNSNSVATLQIVRIPQDGEEAMHPVENDSGSTANISTIHIPLSSPPLPIHTLPESMTTTATTAAAREGMMADTPGPWSAEEDHAASLFGQRMQHDHKVLRYELDLRWKRINLIWSIGSFVLAISITAIVVCFFPKQ